MSSARALATLAAGCFWGVEMTFIRTPGVLSTKVGYTGGNKDSPSYREVCTGTTNHAEAVQVEFDPEKVSYEQLLDVFWSSHDPTTLNRQGPDVGTQYRSAIFYHDEEQKKIAEASKEKAAERFSSPIVTEIVPATSFWEAEDYHQKYLIKHGQETCGH